MYPDEELKKPIVVGLVKAALDKMGSKAVRESLQHAFEASGIYPLDPERVLRSELICCTFFRNSF